METIPWYKSAVIRQQVVMLIVGIFGLFKITTDLDVDATVTAVFADIAVLVPVWTILTRLFKAHPPLTDTAAMKEEDVQKQLKSQKGFIKIQAVLLLLGVSVALAACTGFQMAWKAADTVDKQAYVLAEQYASLVHEAADLKEKPTTPAAAVNAMQKADQAAKPAIARLRTLRDAYRAIDSAENAETLQKAVNDAVLLIADLVNAVKAAKGGE